ncbi:hypothetical protein [Halomarina oriensis]|uniref:M48 family metalloprotease n=1 Tax=Halomarina oriensis TaxID=671145 RepID=A0A6B0GLV3_9EURY|nr:hypothetical protein [Halomarina oriensis]MWG35630.1 hypothetical protein [Halomarina oriensis]
MTSSLPTLALWYLGSTAAFAGLSWLLSRWAIRAENAEERVSRLGSRTLVVVAGVEGAGLYLFGAYDLVTAGLNALLTDPLWPVAVFGGTLVLGAATATTALGCYLVMLPAVREGRDLDLSLAGNAVRVARQFFAGVLVFAVIGAFGIVATTGIGGWAPVVVFVAFALLHAVTPYTTRLSLSPRDPTDDEATRLRRACERVAFDPRGVHVVDTEGTENLLVNVTGVRGRRHLFVSRHLLDVTDDERLAVLVGIETNRARRGQQAVKFALLAGLAALGVSMVNGALARTAATLETSVWGPFLGGVAVVVLLAWVAGRLTYRADAATDAQVGTGTVHETMQWLLDEQGASRDRSTVTNLLQQTRSLGARMERLRDGGETGGSVGSES